ncbi:MAG: 2-dehydropantoate 2-reductase [Alphaproteobacteria bacterium]|nr:2-dehydropantoate 2-reductase [Alphaproteobacteria bacterium]
MRIAIIGAGAIGGYIGAGLALAGEDVTLVARGPHLAAIQRNGLKLLIGGQEKLARPKAIENPADAGTQDAVFVTLKAHQVPAMAERLRPLLGPDTAVVFAVNGVPWWYFYKLPGPWENRRLESIDPGNKQWDLIGPERAIGCVVYPACEVIEPGVIKHVEGDRFTLGEPDGSRSERLKRIASAMIAAGFKVPARSNIRSEIWMKLWGNLAFNPLSALTHATLDVIATAPGTRAIARAMMVEAQAVAEKLGIAFVIDVDRRIQGAAEVGAHKTSMLQDLERGRPLEIDALVTVVAELGRLVGVASPTIDTILALVSQRARIASVRRPNTAA